jgi:uncharacterized protein (DUF58 family)
VHNRTTTIAKGARLLAVIVTLIALALMIASYGLIVPIALFALLCAYFLASSSAQHTLHSYTVVYPTSPLAELLDLTTWPTSLPSGSARDHLLAALWWTAASVSHGREFFASNDSRFIYVPEHRLTAPTPTSAQVEMALSIWEPHTPGMLASLSASLSAAALLQNE